MIDSRITVPAMKPWLLTAVGLAILPFVAYAKSDTSSKESPPPAASAATTQRTTGTARAPVPPRPPYAAAVEALIKKDPESVEFSSRVYILLPRQRPAGEPAFVALAFSNNLGNRGGTWELFVVVDGQAKSLGEVETPNLFSIRLFRTGPGTAVFRRFYYEMDPQFRDPADVHKGEYDELELKPSGTRASLPQTPIDFRTKLGRALWLAPDRDMYACKIESFQRTGSCVLEKDEETAQGAAQTILNQLTAPEAVLCAGSTDSVCEKYLQKKGAQK